MGHKSLTLPMTLKKIFVYFKPVHVRNPESQMMPLLDSAIIRDFRMVSFSMKGSSLVSEVNDKLHWKIDEKTVATDIVKSDEEPPSRFSECLPAELQSRVRVVDTTFLRHLYQKCDSCAHFTSDIGALGHECPHCRRPDWPPSALYFAQSRQEQAMQTHWYRSGPTSFLVTDDLESHLLSTHQGDVQRGGFPEEANQGYKVGEGAREVGRSCLTTSPGTSRTGTYQCKGCGRIKVRVARLVDVMIDQCGSCSLFDYVRNGRQAFGILYRPGNFIQNVEAG